MTTLPFSIFAAGAPVLLARRGRSLARLIEGLQDGDPMAWTILAVIIAAVLGTLAFKHYQRRNESAG